MISIVYLTERLRPSCQVPVRHPLIDLCERQGGSGRTIRRLSDAGAGALPRVSMVQGQDGPHIEAKGDWLP